MTENSETSLGFIERGGDTMDVFEAIPHSKFQGRMPPWVVTTMWDHVCR